MNEPDSQDPAVEPMPEPAAEPAPQSQPVPAPPPRRRRGRVLRAVLVALPALLLLSALWQWLTWPDVAALARESPATTAFIEQARRQGVEVDHRWVPYGRISPHLKRAVLAAEDIGFFDHDGFETEEMKKALREAWQERRLPRGASTLTQQVAKNLWLSPSRNPWRKVKEALLTAALERHLDKRRIFEIYLNVAQLGPGVYGAEAAARRYFGKPASALGEHEAAQLAAALPRPRTWHPGVNSRGYRWKTNLVLQRMRQAGWLWKVVSLRGEGGRLQPETAQPRVAASRLPSLRTKVTG